MAASLPDGAVLAISTTYGTPKVISAITNANPGNATSTAHGFANGAVLEVKSGWGRLDSRAVRVANTTANAFDLEKIDTTSTQFYPSGSGAGSAREITGWAQISQVLTFETSGGDQQFANYSFLENDFENQIPTITSAQSIRIGIADDPTLPGTIAIAAAAELRALRVLRLTLPNGGVLYFNGIVSFNPTPNLTKGQVMAVTANFSLQARVTRY